MSNIDSVIVIFTDHRPEMGVTVFGFNAEHEANTWIQEHQAAPNGLRGHFHISWITEPFEPKEMTYRDIPAMTVGSRVLDSTPQVARNVIRLKSVKLRDSILAMKMELGVLGRYGRMGYRWGDMDRMTRIILQVPQRIRDAEDQSFYNNAIPFGDQ
jgi:hypothetical protein